MLNTALYGATVAIWGSTWLAITYQLGSVAVTTAVGYRFALASLILLAWCAIRRVSLVFTAHQYGLIAAQGFCLFGVNYGLVYLAEERIPSGLVAVAFTTVVIMNLIGSRLVFGQAITWRTFGGAVFAVIGVALVFQPELARFEGSRSGYLGLAAGLGATVFASAGNLLSVHNQRAGIGVIAGNTLGMASGAILMLAIGALGGAGLAIPLTVPFLSAMIYLALFGSVLAFGAYLTLIGRIGATQASYCGVLIPIVALLLSTAFEDYRWQPASIIGVSLCLLGNVLVISRRS